MAQNNNSRARVALTIVRILLVIVLTILFIISAIYFVISIDAIGDDIDSAQETHLTHDPFGRHMYGVTESSKKEHHISSLIIWVVVTMMAAIFTAAGIIGTIWINPCLVIFSAIMVFLFALSGIFLPDIGLTLPKISSNFYMVGLEIVAIILSVLFAFILNRWGVQRVRPRREKGVTFAQT